MTQEQLDIFIALGIAIGLIIISFPVRIALDKLCDWLDELCEWLKENFLNNK